MKSRAIAIKYKKYLIANTKNRKSKLRMNHPIGALPLVYFLHPEPLEKKIVPLLAPKFSSKQWVVTLLVTISIALFIALSSFKNAAIPLAALFGALTFYVVTSHVGRKPSHAN